MAVAHKTGQQEVANPEGYQESWCDIFVLSRATQLTTNCTVSPANQQNNCEEGKHTENCDREGQSARMDAKYCAVCCMVDGSNTPCNTNSKEHVDSVAAGYITNGRICIFVIDGSNFAGKCVWKEENKSI